MRSRTLSEPEARVILSLEARGQELVTLAELRKVAGVSAGYGRKLAHGLVRKGWFQRARAGQYVLNPSRNGPDAIPDSDPFVLGSHLAAPYYFGYATAAELLGLLHEASRVYYLVTPSRSERIVRGGVSYRLVHAPERRIWGTQRLVRRDHALIVSDPERTLVDGLSRPELSGGLPGVARILRVASPRLNWRRLDRYLTRLGVQSLPRRLGYLIEHLRLERPPPGWALRAWHPPPTAPFAPLGPPSVYGRRGHYDERWRILDNVDLERLLGEVRSG
jgi:predicted transcriptional regulator of viral defense system